MTTGVAAAHQSAPPHEELLRSTRSSTVLAVVFLGFQLYGNLYEEIVTNTRAIAHPVAGQVVGELAPGSPLFFYLPWAPIGVVLVVVLAVRLHRSGPAWVARRLVLAAGALAIAVVAKGYLIGRLNPTARDVTVPADLVRAESVQWAVVNGVAILAVATALVLLTSWRTAPHPPAGGAARRVNRRSPLPPAVRRPPPRPVPRS